MFGEVAVQRQAESGGRLKIAFDKSPWTSLRETLTSADRCELIQLSVLYSHTVCLSASAGTPAAYSSLQVEIREFSKVVQTHPESSEVNQRRADGVVDILLVPFLRLHNSGDPLH